MKSDSATFVKLTFRDQVGGMGLLITRKRADAAPFPVNRNLRQKLLAVAFNAKNAELVVFLCRVPILLIYAYRHIAQILNSIVRWIAVNVIDMVRGLHAMNVNPRESVRQIRTTVDPNPQISLPIIASCDGSSLGVAAGADAPRKHARFAVVVKKFAQTLRGKIGLSHDAVLSLIGQRPVSVSSTCGLRYFRVFARDLPSAIGLHQGHVPTKD